MKNMWKDALILFAITLIAGLVLGVVYQVTKEPIAAQEEKARQEACMEVFADAAEFETLDISALETENSGEWNELGFPGVEIGEVMTALASDKTPMGYVITVTSHEGYGGDIKFMMGVRSDGTLNGISLLAISETAGLGMKAEEVLKPQFKDKKAERFEYSKSGAVGDNQIDAISGATITTGAVTDAVNAGLYYFRTQLAEGGSVDE